MMRLLVKFPTRGRPGLFWPNLANYFNRASGRHEIQVVVTADSDDPTMATDAARRRLAEDPRIRFRYGDPRTKIAAINADMDLADPWDVVINGQDDIVPVKDYDATICDAMVAHFPDLDGALHLDDHYAGGDKRCSFVVMGREYYDRFGYLYYPGYRSVFADDEFTAVGRHLGRLPFVEGEILIHQWIGKSRPDDATHQRNELAWAHDRALFESRRAINFGL
jgi:hypothetical protein